MNGNSIPFSTGIGVNDWVGIWVVVLVEPSDMHTADAPVALSSADNLKAGLKAQSALGCGQMRIQRFEY